ncbi:MAG: calcium-binding protein [Burkholderiales bacterium]|nr:calcium-binding protein [Burkholderiales bacterium]
MSWGWGNWYNWYNWSNYPGTLEYSVDNSTASGTEQQAATPFQDVSYYHQPGVSYNSGYGSNYDMSAWRFDVSVQDATSADQLTLSLPSGFSMSGNQLSYNGSYFGTVSGGTDGSTLTVNIDNYRNEHELIAQLIEGVRWTNTSDTPPASRTLSLVVYENDYAYSNDSVTVSLTAVDDEPTGTVTISGEATEDETLTAANTLDDPDGNGTITYQWLRDGDPIADATGSTYTLTNDDAGSVISVQASYTDGSGNLEIVTSAGTAPVVPNNVAPTGSVEITGTPTQGQVLTASNDLADGDGLGDIGYQWLRDGAPIADATGTTYLLAQADVGATISVVASYTDDGGEDEAVTSGATAEVANINDGPSGTVTITGAATQGETLSASDTLDDADGLSGPVSYQWLRDGAPIVDATGATYTLTQDDVDTSISVTASYTDDTGEDESATSDATGAVANANDAPTGTLLISGTAAEDQVLAVQDTLQDLDGRGGLTTYQWLRDGTPVDGALGVSFTLTQDDVGAVITVTASYTDGYGEEEAVTSGATAEVANVNDAPSGTVTITGAAIEDGTLALSNSLDDEDGLGTIGYQWQADGIDIEGATGATLQLTQAEVGQVITVVASYTDAWGTDESVPSAPSAPVQNLNDPPAGTVTISGTARQNQVLTATASITDEDGLGTFNYQWLRNGLVIQGATGSTYLLAAADADTYVSVRVSYTDGWGTVESVTSDPTVLVGAHKVGMSGNDSLAGGLANDSLQGMAGNDTLDGAAGADTMEGGTGNDTYRVDSVDDIVRETGTYDLRDVVVSSISYALANDTITGQMADMVEDLRLAEDAGAAWGQGNIRNNALTGNSYANTFWGEDGHDTIDGGGGNDLMYGGAGNDTFIVDSTDDVVVEADGQGADRVNASASYTLPDHLETLTLTGIASIDGVGNGLSNTINGNNGNNRLSGGAGNDTINGLVGDDTLDGGAGIDSMAGGAGNDVYEITELLDKATEGSTGGTADVANVHVSGYTMATYVEVGNLVAGATLAGNAQANTITGNTGSNTLTGAGGNDTISGGDGNDQLNGGAGRDWLTGGAGNDTFIYTLVTESATAAAGDVITDFTPGFDRISLLAIDANTSLSGNQNFTYIGDAGFSAAGSTSGVAEVRYNPATGFLEASNDADAVAEFVVFIGTGLNVADVGNSIVL